MTSRKRVECVAEHHVHRILKAPSPLTSSSSSSITSMTHRWFTGHRWSPEYLGEQRSSVNIHLQGLSQKASNAVACVVSVFTFNSGVKLPYKQHCDRCVRRSLSRCLQCHWVFTRPFIMLVCERCRKWSLLTLNVRCRPRPSCNLAYVVYY